MSRLLDVLVANGAIEEYARSWTAAHRDATGVSRDTALLELDLVDEEDLLRGLESYLGLPAVRSGDLDAIDPDAARALPQPTDGQSWCPLRSDGGRLVIMVPAQLGPEQLAAPGFVGLEIDQRAAPAHYLALARRRIYGTPVPRGADQLEARLARRRRADVRWTLGRMAESGSFSVAVEEALAFATCLVEFCGVLVVSGTAVRLAAVRGGNLLAGAEMPLPPKGCSLEAALLHRGYHVGPLEDTEQNQLFYRSLSRPVPRFAVLAPVPVAGAPPIGLLADNGQRGMAPGWTADLSLLAVRLGQRANELATRRAALRRTEAAAADHASAHRPQGPAEPAAEPAAELAIAPQPAPPTVPAGALQAGPQGADLADGLRLSLAEQRAIVSLRIAASAEGVPVDLFVDALLRQRTPPSVGPAALDIVGEVRELFDRLAASIPAQLATGMADAFRDIAPRNPPSFLPASAALPRGDSELAASSPQPAPSPAPVSAPTPAPVLVHTARPAPRAQAPSYRERRSRMARTKL